jgi:hypothetical protein
LGELASAAECARAAADAAACAVVGSPGESALEGRLKDAGAGSAPNHRSTCTCGLRAANHVFAFFLPPTTTTAATTTSSFFRTHTHARTPPRPLLSTHPPRTLVSISPAVLPPMSTTAAQPGRAPAPKNGAPPAPKQDKSRTPAKSTAARPSAPASAAKPVDLSEDAIPPGATNDAGTMARLRDASDDERQIIIDRLWDMHVQSGVRWAAPRPHARTNRACARRARRPSSRL